MSFAVQNLRGLAGVQNAFGQQDCQVEVKQIGELVGNVEEDGLVNSQLHGLGCSTRSSQIRLIKFI